MKKRMVDMDVVFAMIDDVVSGLNLRLAEQAGDAIMEGLTRQTIATLIGVKNGINEVYELMEAAKNNENLM